MLDYKQLCKEVDGLEFETYRTIINQKSYAVLPALAELCSEEKDVMTMLAMFMMASACADGNVTEKEFEVIRPAMKAMFGADFPYEDTLLLLNEKAKDFAFMSQIKSVLREVVADLSEPIQNDLLMISLLICAVDGKVSEKERNYIEQICPISNK